jgi:hypothetical protein
VNHKRYKNPICQTEQALPGNADAQKNSSIEEGKKTAQNHSYFKQSKILKRLHLNQLTKGSSTSFLPKQYLYKLIATHIVK